MGKRIYPTIRDTHESVKSAIELAFTGIHEAHDRISQIHIATQGAIARLVPDPLDREKILAALPGYDLMQAGSSKGVGQTQGSIAPDITGGFGFSLTTTSITWGWTTLREYPPHLWNEPQRFYDIPDGSAAATGLAPNTPYYFYPYLDLASGFLKWALDSSLLVGAGAAFAHSARSVLAAQEMYGDGHKPLSNGAMSQTTTASGTGGGTGGGGSGCPRGDMLVKHCTHGLMPARELKPFDLIRDRLDLITMVKSAKRFKASRGVLVECSNGEHEITTASHRYPLIDVPEVSCAGDLSLASVMVDAHGDPIRINRLVPVEEEAEYVAIETDSHTFACGAVCGDIWNHNVSTK